MKVTYWHRPQAEKREREVEIPYFFGYSSSDDRWGYTLVGRFDGKQTMTIQIGYQERDKQYEVEVSPGPPEESNFEISKVRTAIQFEEARAEVLRILGAP